MQVPAGLLRGAKASLLEVAVGAGYESEAAFFRAFKRPTRLTPDAWRGSSWPEP